MNCFVLQLVKKEGGVFSAGDVVETLHKKEKRNKKPMSGRSHCDITSSTP